MLMNSEECTLGSQVRNQSVEKGSMPLGGDTPLASLYSLSKRSRDSVVSDSSTCGRAPSSIISIASWVSRISVNRLFLLIGTFPLFWKKQLNHRDTENTEEKQEVGESTESPIGKGSPILRSSISGLSLCLCGEEFRFITVRRNQAKASTAWPAIRMAA